MQLEVLLTLTTGTSPKAERLISFFLQDEAFSQDNVAKACRIRKGDPALQITPLLAMVDEGRREDVIVELSKNH